MDRPRPATSTATSRPNSSRSTDARRHPGSSGPAWWSTPPVGWPCPDRLVRQRRGSFLLIFTGGVDGGSPAGGSPDHCGGGCRGVWHRRRTNRHQVAVRQGLYRALREAFTGSGIAWADCDRADRGDGVFILVPPEVPKGLFAEPLPLALVTALQAHNSTYPVQEWIRLRMAVHAGEVTYDEHGVTAAAVNLAFRLVEAPALKAALTGSAGVLAVIASSWFFDEVIAHCEAGVSAAYRRAEVRVKETAAVGWIALPDDPDPAGAVDGAPGDSSGLTQIGAEAGQ